MKRLIFVFVSILFSLFVFAQDLDYAKTVMEKLCAADMFGRGYISAGDKKAAYFIENEFIKFGLLPFDTVVATSGSRVGQPIKTYQQEFSMKVNTFPETVKLMIDKTELKPGIDFLVSPSSGPTPLKELDIYYLAPRHIKDDAAFENFMAEDFTGYCMVIDVATFEKEPYNKYIKKIIANEMKADAIMLLTNDLMWGVSTYFEKFPTVIVKKEVFPKKAEMVTLKIDTKFYYDYKTQNVIGMVKGKKYPNKYIIIGAHYDHLGCMGKNLYFPGANDNASGVAMMLDLARHYADVFNQPDYSMIFIGFGAEEAGFMGSKYFTEHSKISLADIRLMINLDMMSTGETGLMVMNGKSEFTKMKSINTSKKYLVDIQSRQNSPISDHYPFTEKKVNAIYLYLMGDPQKNYHYHGIGDVPSNVSMKGYEGAFRLITDYLSALD